MLDEDEEEVGQTEVFNKTVKRKKVVEFYFDAASIIDINNHMRQGGLALETAWRTQSWTNRVVATVLGIVETDAYLLYKKFHPGSSKLSHSNFTEAVAKALLMQISTGTQPNHRKRIENENEHLLHNFVLLKSLPLYNKDSELCTATNASRLCSVCRSPCRIVVVFAQMHQMEKSWLYVDCDQSKDCSCCIVNIVPCIHIQLLTLYMYVYIH